LHSHQPLAVRAKSKSGRVPREIVVLAGIEKERMPMIGVEGPELVKPTAVFLFLEYCSTRILRSGDLKIVSSASRLKPAAGPSAKAGAAEAMPTSNRTDVASVAEHICIPGSRLVAETVPEVRTKWRINANGPND
jgi:hypothetical protein